MTGALLPAVELETGNVVTASIIWLHGLGADGHDFEPIVPELRLPAATGMRFIFPHAPMRPVTINAGMRMRAWYDFLTLTPIPTENPRHIGESITAVSELIEREQRRGIAARRIVVAGFSQGGVVALHAALRHRQPLAGIIALSTYLPLHIQLPPPGAAGTKRMPIFMAHGSVDPVIPVQFGLQAATWLQHAGYPTQWQVYAMGHGVCAEEIDAIRDWLLPRLEPGG